MSKIENITVFCASSTKLDDKFKKVAEDAGDFMAKNGYNLVFGGANIGLMKIVAQKFFDVGNKVTGIIPEFFVARGLASECSTEIIVTEDMFERKKLLIEKGDAFLILPGGFGTLDELLEVVTLNQIGRIDKPVVIFDPLDFYSNLIKQFEEMEKNGFTVKDDHSYFVAKSVEDLKRIFDK